MELGHVMDDHPLGDVTWRAGIVGAAGDRDVDRLEMGHAPTVATSMSPIKTRM